MFFSRLLFLIAVVPCLLLAFVSPARPATVLVVQFHNGSNFSDLNWVGESISETLQDEFGSQNEIVFGRELRSEAAKRMSLRPGADYTKATLIRLGQSLDADYVFYGTYDAALADNSPELKNASVQISAHVIDLRKLHNGPDWAEAGKLVDLTRLEEHLAWQSLRFLDPSLNLPLDRFLNPLKLIRVDAEESYIRGLLSTNRDQKLKWFAQASALDPHFTNPAYELGKLSLERKEYRQALSWFSRISPTDSRFPEARFQMGLAAFGAADYSASGNYFREVAKTFPLNEVYNNLGAAEDQMNQPNAADDFRHALEGDPNDPIYLFNLGNTMLKHTNFEGAEKQFQAVLSHTPGDVEASNLLGRAQRHEFNNDPSKALPTDRLKQNFDLTAFRQFKAVVQSKSAP